MYVYTIGKILMLNSTALSFLCPIKPAIFVHGFALPPDFLRQKQVQFTPDSYLQQHEA